MNIKRYVKTVLVSSVIYFLFFYCWLKLNPSPFSPFSVFLWCQATAIYTISISIIDIIGFMFDRNWIIEKTLLGIKLSEKMRKMSTALVIVGGAILLLSIQAFFVVFFLFRFDIVREMIKTASSISESGSVFPFLHIEIIISIIFSQAIALSMLFISKCDTMSEEQHMKILTRTMVHKKSLIFDPSQLLLGFPISAFVRRCYFAVNGVARAILLLLCGVIVAHSFHFASKKACHYCELTRGGAQNTVAREKIGFIASIPAEELLYIYMFLYLLTAYLQWRVIAVVI